MHERKGLGRGVLRAWLIVVFVALFLPMLVMIMTSFNESRYGALPFRFSLRWYRQLASDTALIDATTISVRLACYVAGAALVIGTLLAVWLAKAPTVLKVPVDTAMITSLTVPALIMSVGMVVVVEWLGLGQSEPSLVLTCLTASLPYVTLIVTARMRELDPALAEAARSLGAGPVRVFLRVTAPLVAPGILAGGMLAFVVCFNNFAIQLFIAPVGVQTLPVQIYSMVRLGITPDVNALGGLIVAATVVLILLMQWLGGSAARMVTNVGKAE